MTYVDQTHKTIRAVIIDDDEISNFIYTRVIESSGRMETKSFMGAKSALNYLVSLAENNPDKFPEIIFLDINMPVMNGWAFLDDYRDKIPKKLKDQTILCILSSSVYREDIDRAAGYKNVTEYLPKPLTTDSLSGVINKYFNK